jgi:hypothetical protein
MRFGTVLEDEQSVREQLLAANAEHLDSLLKRLSGCVQMTVKGSYDEDRLVHEVVTASPSLAGLVARVRKLPEAAAYYERIRLGTAIAEAVARRREADEKRALDLLEPKAEAARVEEVGSAADAFNLSFLVKRTRQRGFSRRVRELIEEAGDRIVVRYVGPLPPYSFAEGELETGAV